jgi:hypothetical protein
MVLNYIGSSGCHLFFCVIGIIGCGSIVCRELKEILMESGLLGRPRRRWEDDNRKNIWEIGSED